MICMIVTNDNLLSDKELVTHFVLQRIRDDGDNLVDFLLYALTSSLGERKIGLLQYNVVVTRTQNLNGGHGKGYVECVGTSLR